MLLTVQFPIADARPFTDVEAWLLKKPTWPLARELKSFVRGFGATRKRKEGGQDPWPDECLFVDARQALKYVHLERQLVGDCIPRGAFRRLFCTSIPKDLFDLRPPVARVDIGFQASIHDLDDEALLSTALDLLDLNVSVNQLGQARRECKLLQAGEYLATLYGQETLCHGERAEKAGAARIGAGEPMVLIQYRPHEVDQLPEHAETLAPAAVSGVELSFMWLEFHGRQVGLWFLEDNQPDPKVARRIRRGVSRLHAEYQALKHILNLIRLGEIDRQPDTAQGKAVRRYLGEARQYLVGTKGSFQHDSIRQVLDVYGTLVAPGERELMRQDLTALGVGSLESILNGHPVQRRKTFISYSHKDEEWLDRLATMIAPLEETGLTSIWDDRKIRPGQNWLPEIRKALAETKIAVLLVSPNFLASDFIVHNELQSLLEAHRRGDVKIFWVYLDTCLWQATPLEHIQASNSLTEPLAALGFGKQQAALAEVGLQILKELKQHSSPS